MRCFQTNVQKFAVQTVSIFIQLLQRIAHETLIRTRIVIIMTFIHLFSFGYTYICYR